MHFADRLNERIDEVRSRLVVGIDPDPRRLYAENSLFVRANPGLSRQALLDALCDVVIGASENTACAVKPQAAFFESMGLAGLASLARCIKRAKGKGIPVILDAKRGDTPLRPTPPPISIRRPSSSPTPSPSTRTWAPIRWSRS